MYKGASLLRADAHLGFHACPHRSVINKKTGVINAAVLPRGSLRVESS